MTISAADKLSSLIMSDGYSPVYSNIEQLINTARFENYTNTTTVAKTTPSVKTYYTTERIWVPPTLGYPGSPAIPATSTIVTLSSNKGWNSWARSINPLERKQLIRYSLSLSNEGCTIGIAAEKKEGLPIGSFSHAMSIDRSGIYVYENGIRVKQLKGSRTKVHTLNIYRSISDEIFYTAMLDSDTVLYKSPSKYTNEAAYVYAYLYSSGDQILNAEFLSGRAQFGSV